MDENNQYSHAMTKPLPYDCIKKMAKIPTLSGFNAILSRLSHTDKIGHLFIVDIIFHNKNEKQCFLTKFTRLFSKK